jgi:AcrR family transcriptional regulator
MAAHKIAKEPYRTTLRTKALEIAVRTIEDAGLAGLQARLIAAKAGCSVGSLYNVFGDLDGLVVAVNEGTLELLEDPLTRAFKTNEAEPTAIRLTALALAYMQFAFDNQNRWRAVFEHQPQNEVPAHYRERQARLLSLIEKTVSGEIATPEMRTRAARALFASVHGIIALALDNRISAFDAANVEGEIRFIVAAAARGLAEAQAT